MNKSISIFLASSEELYDDRIAFGDFIRSLNDIYQRKNISIRLLKWENFDSSINTSTQGGKTHRKQDEYNQKIDKSDIFVALFHTKAGKFTIEEFNYAMKLFEDNKSPQIFVYFKDLDDNTKEDKSLSDFKSTLYDEMGHYWGHYNSRESLHFSFVMQLLLQIEARTDDIKVEDGQVKLYDVTIASMQSLGFASGNDTYQQMRKKLSDYPQKIEKLRSMIDRAVDEEMRQMMDEQLQDNLNDFNDLKKKYTNMEKNLLDTALRITKMEQENVSEMVRRAIDAFEKGNISLANELLDEVAQEAENHFKKLESQQELVHKDIDALLLQAKTVMVDAATPIEERKEQTLSIYKKADLWAERSRYDIEKYIELLDDFYTFLRKYGNYNEALEILEREGENIVNFYGKESQENAWIYCKFGNIYSNLGGKNGNLKALDYYDKGIQIAEKIENNENQISILYNDKAIALNALCRYKEALNHYKKALAIDEKLYGKKHIQTAIAYGNIAEIYNTLDQQDEAVRFQDESIKIKKELFGEDNLEMVEVYTAMAFQQIKKGEPYLAMELCQKALNILLRELGMYHPRTASAYETIGRLYSSKYEEGTAIKYFNKALLICKKVLHKKDYDTNVASIYDALGLSLMYLFDFKEAHNNFLKALDIYKKTWGDEHMDIANEYCSLLLSSFALHDYDAALEYGLKAKQIIKKYLGKYHIKYTEIEERISMVKSHQEKSLGNNSHDTV